ncbi:hypothetical protein ACV34Z_35205, partial [Pseudomonas aeruginosa]
LNQVRDDTGLSAAAAGLLTTAPVLCLGLFAPLAPRLARRIGAERSVLLILFCLAGEQAEHREQAAQDDAAG